MEERMNENTKIIIYMRIILVLFFIGITCIGIAARFIYKNTFTELEYTRTELHRSREEVSNIKKELSIQRDLNKALAGNNSAAGKGITELEITISDLRNHFRELEQLDGQDRAIIEYCDGLFEESRGIIEESRALIQNMDSSE
jgi:hypothetical protein